MKKDLVFKCFDCDFLNHYEVVDYYDLTKNVELYKNITNDSLFTFKCNNCNKEEVVLFDSSYVDNLYKFFIKLSEDKNLTILNDDKFFNIRIVSSLNDLKEKLRIFYSFLDDRVVEIIKYLIVEDFNRYNDIKINEIYFNKKEENDDLSFILFSKNDFLGIINYQIEGYQKLYLKYRNKFNSLNQRIDENFVKKII